MKTISYLTSLLIIFSTVAFGQEIETTSENDEAAIVEVIFNSYVKGIHIERDEEAVRAGFHHSFIMHVYDDGQIVQASLDIWIEHLQLDGVKNTNRIKSEFNLIDISGNTAVVRMEIYENSRHLYTDYFGLYKFPDGWKIINKIYYAPE